MTIFLRGAYALTLVAALASGVSTQAANEVDFASQLAVASTNGTGDTQLVCYDGGDCDSCGDYGSCGGGCSSGGCGLGGGLGLGDGLLGSRCGQFFVGAEYLSLRANFSEATAYLDTDVANNTQTLHQFDFDYTDSYRIFAGYRLCDCGGEIRFTYSNLESDGSFDSGVLDTNGGTRAFTAPFENPAVNGGRITGQASVSIDNYDIAFAKTIPLGSPLGCCDSGCGECCDPCGGCCPSCPAWDLQWSGAIRVANVDSRLDYLTTDASPSVPGRAGESVMSFDGIGLRTGLLGRRYIGKSGMFSIFVRGDISLLLGEVEYSTGSNVLGTQIIRTTEVIPVTELEAGATMWLSQHCSVTGGYMLSAWHDLGHRSNYDFGTGVTEDDANMLMLDGFFFRAEAAF